MYGEKFIEKKIKDNKIIRVNEFKKFSFDYKQIAKYVNDQINDDPEALASLYGIYLGWDSFYSLDCSKCLEALQEYKEEMFEDDPETDFGEVNNYLVKLSEARDFTIYFDNHEDLYKEE